MKIKVSEKALLKRNEREETYWFPLKVVLKEEWSLIRESTVWNNQSSKPRGKSKPLTCENIESDGADSNTDHSLWVIEKFDGLRV